MQVLPRAMATSCDRDLASSHQTSLLNIPATPASWLKAAGRTIMCIHVHLGNDRSFELLQQLCSGQIKSISDKSEESFDCILTPCVNLLLLESKKCWVVLVFLQIPLQTPLTRSWKSRELLTFGGHVRWPPWAVPVPFATFQMIFQAGKACVRDSTYHLPSYFSI